MVSQNKQAECTPYFRPKWQNLYPISDQKRLKTVPFGAAHTRKAYIWEYPPPRETDTPLGRQIYLSGLYMGAPPSPRACSTQSAWVKAAVGHEREQRLL